MMWLFGKNVSKLIYVNVVLLFFASRTAIAVYCFLPYAVNKSCSVVVKIYSTVFLTLGRIRQYVRVRYQRTCGNNNSVWMPETSGLVTYHETLNTAKRRGRSEITVSGDFISLHGSLRPARPWAAMCEAVDSLTPMRVALYSARKLESAESAQRSLLCLQLWSFRERRLTWDR